MITFTEIQQHLGVPFDVYQKLPGASTSFLKQEINGVKPDFVMTDKIRVGSIVDAILTEPAKADMRSPLYPIAKDIAFQLKQTFGAMIPSFIPQVSYTAVAECRGFRLRVRGRLDYLLAGLAVIDLKVTYSNVTDEKTRKALIERMKYDEQMFLYCKFAGVTKAYLLFYCVPKKKCVVHYIDCSGSSPWWEEKIENHGKIQESAQEPISSIPVKPKMITSPENEDVEKIYGSRISGGGGLSPNTDFLK